MPQPDDGFFVWDDGILPRGWAFREGEFCLGGPIEKCPESRKHRFRRLDAANELGFWLEAGSLPPGWRRASSSEIELLSGEPYFQSFLTTGVV